MDVERRIKRLLLVFIYRHPCINGDNRIVLYFAPESRPFMSKTDVKPLRPWRELAKKTAEEHDPNKVVKLAQELIRSLCRRQPSHGQDPPG